MATAQPVPTDPAGVCCAVDERNQFDGGSDAQPTRVLHAAARRPAAREAVPAGLRHDPDDLVGAGQGPQAGARPGHRPAPAKWRPTSRGASALNGLLTALGILLGLAVIAYAVTLPGIRVR